MKSLYEGILGNIDTTISNTDNFLDSAMKEFEELKNYVLNIRNYKNNKSRIGFHWYEISFKIPTLCKLLNVDKNIDTIEIRFRKMHYSKGPGTCWNTEISLYEYYKEYHNYQGLKFSEPMTGPRPSTIIANKLTTIFTDFNTFKTFVNKSLKS